MNLEQYITNDRKLELSCLALVSTMNLWEELIWLIQCIPYSLYDTNRNPVNIEKKMFKLLMMSAVKSWIICTEVKRRKCVTHTFVRRSLGRPSKKARNLMNVGGHLPVEIPSRKCTRCDHRKRKKEQHYNL